MCEKNCLRCIHSLVSDIDTELLCMIKEEIVKEDDCCEEYFEEPYVDMTEFEETKLEGIKIDGIISFNDNKISHETFLDKFIEWVVNNGWEYGGESSPFNPDEE